MCCMDFARKKKNVSAEPSATYPLSPEQLQFYKDNGYLVIKRLIGIPALNTYRQRFTDICERRVDKGHMTVLKDHSLSKYQTKPEDYINKIQELLFDDVFSTYTEDPRMLHVVTQLIGEDITAVNCMLINKPPGTNEHPPHQDILYFPFRPADKILAAWTAIDPVTRDNGCLYMVPGSHKADVFYEHRDQENETKLMFYSIVNSGDVAPEHKRVYLDMEPGDTVFFPSNVVHGSRPNVSQMYRKAMTCHYANSSCHYIDVAGSGHDQLGKEAEAVLKKKGYDVSFVGMWRMRIKQVQGVRSNL